MSNLNKKNCFAKYRIHWLAMYLRVSQDALHRSVGGGLDGLAHLGILGGLGKLHGQVNNRYICNSGQFKGNIQRNEKSYMDFFVGIRVFLEFIFFNC